MMEWRKDEEERDRERLLGPVRRTTYRESLGVLGVLVCWGALQTSRYLRDGPVRYGYLPDLT